MSLKARRRPHQPIAPFCAAVACALLALVTLFPSVASAAVATSTTRANDPLGLPIPPTARVHGTTTPTTATPSPTKPASTTPAAATPTSATQPGTVAPTTTTPASALPQTTSTPASTTPTATTPTTPATATPTTPAKGSTTVILARKSKPHATHLSTGALALAILGALLALGCIVWALSRWLALEPRWTVSLTHSLREASYRASVTWAEFADWARIGH